MLGDNAKFPFLGAPINHHAMSHYPEAFVFTRKFVIPVIAGNISSISVWDWEPAVIPGCSCKHSATFPGQEPPITSTGC